MGTILNWIINWIKDWFSNEDNRGKIFNYIKSFVVYIKNKKLIKTTILYSIIAFLCATSIIQLNIDVKYIMRDISAYINHKIGSSISKKRDLAGRVNKNAIIYDDTNGVFVSEAFTIEKINKDLTASRLPKSGHKKNQKLFEYSWDEQIIDTEKCSNLLLLLKKNKTNCIIKRINNKETKAWVKDCFMIAETVDKVKIDKEVAFLICGIRYTSYLSFFFLYVGEDYSKMEEFKENIFVDKIIPIFNLTNKDFNNIN